jgi:hypothetical protein
MFNDLSMTFNAFKLIPSYLLKDHLGLLLPVKTKFGKYVFMSLIHMIVTKLTKTVINQS